jgi:hypothetical protein
VTIWIWPRVRKGFGDPEDWQRAGHRPRGLGRQRVEGLALHPERSRICRMTALFRYRTFLAAAALLIVAAAADFGIPAHRLAAQTTNAIDQAIVDAFRWRSIGPDRGGRSIAVSGVRGRPREAYFGAVGGGLWKTTDGGTSWAPVTDGQIKSSSVGAVAVSESNPDVVYIGMGEACIRGNIMPGDGVYKSTDAGKTWTHIGFPNSDAISKIRIHPTNPDVVFVADFGKYGTTSDERGVYKSTDGGKTWKKVLGRDNKTGAIDVEIDRKNPNVMFAALWEAYPAAACSHPPTAATRGRRSRAPADCHRASTGR